jgi:hypothetical protein
LVLKCDAHAMWFYANRAPKSTLAAGESDKLGNAGVKIEYAGELTPGAAWRC